MAGPGSLTTLKSLLRQINSLPFEATLKRYYPAPASLESRLQVDLTTPKGWDEVRTQEGNFLIPETRARWQRMCETPIVHDSAAGDLPARAYCILDLIEQHRLGPQFYSLGVGLAALEYHVKRLNPALEVFCSDCGEVTTSRLGKVFRECNGITKFDLLEDSFHAIYPNAKPNPFVLIHRVDPQLSDAHWIKVFAGLRKSGVDHALFVPYKILTLRHLLEFKRRELWQRLSRVNLAFCGYVRTRRRLVRLWGNSFEIIAEPKIGYSQGFLLKQKN